MKKCEKLIIIMLIMISIILGYSSQAMAADPETLTWVYDQPGEVYKFTAPMSATYVLEAWGAQRWYGT